MKRRRREYHGAEAAIELLEDRTLLSGIGLGRQLAPAAALAPAVATTPVAIPPVVDPNQLVSQSPVVASAPPFSLDDTFQLHSNPGATKVIYLDFDGNTTTGSVWNSAYNNGNPIVTPAYSFEGDVSANFTNAELERIQKIWQRVAEDFIPFDVDVTTEDPGTAALRNTGGSDDEWGARICIGGSWTDWYDSSAGGVSYVGVFNNSDARPSFVFENNTANGDEKSTAEAISHETGHSLGLNHDGTSTLDYYEGHGSGATGWAPIMGVGYYQELTQWSQGEYNDANNTEDDLQIITTQNGFDYRADDHGDADAAATATTQSGNSLSAAGIIEQNNDVDVFSFFSTGGQLDLDVVPFENSPNLDILAELYDSTGGLVAASNPLGSLNASFNLMLNAGAYFLRVDGTGKGDPLGTGYSDYGSLGSYTVTGASGSRLVFDSTDVPRQIANLGTITSTLMISDDLVIDDINVGLDISQNWDWDLDVFLIGPHGARVELFTDVGGFDSDFTGTILDDEAPSITGGSAPFTGTFAPEGSLADFDGRLAQGNWTLEITDDDTFIVPPPPGGTLNSWSLSILPRAIEAGVTITQSGGSTDVSEAGASDTYSVVLDAQPPADVTITLDPDTQLAINGGAAGVATTLTFTEANWDTGQTVTVAAVDDATYEGNHVGTIVQTVSSTDADYDGLFVVDLVVNVADNDPPVNSDPVVTLTSSALAYREDDGGVPLDAGLTVADADDATLSSATVQITGNLQPFEDVLSYTGSPGFGLGWNAITGTLTLTGSASVADYQAALRSITYTNTSQTPSTSTRTVTVIVNDGTTDSNAATREIIVAAVNDAPFAGDDSATINEDASSTIDVLNNDNDADLDTLGVISASDPVHGTAVINADDTITYAPAPNYNGPDSFTYTVNDGNGGTDTGTVSILVGATDDPIGSLTLSYTIPPPFPFLAENSGTTTGTVTRAGSLSDELVVQLSSSDTSVLTVPATVTIAAGQASADFTITIVDDTILDGDHWVTISGTAGDTTGGPLLLDSSFGNGGIATTPLEMKYQPPESVVTVLPDGKILAASAIFQGEDWRLTRLNADGSLDTTFGNAGSVDTSIPGSDGATPKVITVLPDGKILVGGNAHNDTSDAVLVRYNADGTLDTSFYNGGINTINDTTGWLVDIAVGPGGKIWVAIAFNGSTFFKVARLTSDGFMDTSFGNGGIRQYSVNELTAEIELTADGGFLLAGGEKVAKFGANGNPITSFGNNGVATADFGTSERAMGLEELPDGKIVVGYRLSDGDFAAARLKANGTFDFTFDGDGLARAVFGGQVDYTTTMVVQPDGSILLGGITKITDFEFEQTIERLRPDGSVDTSFDGDGRFQQSYLSGNEHLLDMAVHGQQLITLGGWGGDWRIFRYGLPGVVIAAEKDVFVADMEELTVAVSDTTFTEGDPVGVATMTITRNNTDIGQPLVVTPVTGVDGQVQDGFLVLPNTVTILAGQSSITFDIGVADDLFVNGMRQFEIAATATGYMSNVVDASVAGDDLGALGADNILVTRHDDYRVPDQIREYTLDGTLVRIFNPQLYGERWRDLAVDVDGNIQAWHDRSSSNPPLLKTIDPVTGNVQSHGLLSGWNTGGDIYSGGVATLNNWIFVTDVTYGSGPAKGIIRFDRTTGSSVRFASEDVSAVTGFDDLAVGLDGLLYGMAENHAVYVYDPATLERLRQVEFPDADRRAIRGIAVNAAGEIFATGSGGQIFKYNGQTGQLLATSAVLVSSYAGLTDINARADGTIVAGSSRDGHVVVTNEQFSSVTTFTPPSGGAMATFVAFAATPPVVNLRPFANESSFTTDEDSGYSGSVTGSDPESQTLSYAVATGPDHGLLVLNTNGTFIYTPEANYAGSDSFTFTVGDNHWSSLPAMVSITVNAINDAPIFGSTSYDFSVAENSAAGTTVGTADATDVDDTSLTYSITGGNTSGAFAIDAATGQITVADATQLDFETTSNFSLTVKVSDAARFDIATVSIGVSDIVAPLVTGVDFGYGTDRWADSDDLAGRTAPWEIKQIRIQFSRDVAVDEDDLVVTGTTGTYTFSGFTYNSSTFTAVWTLATPIRQDRVTFALDGDGSTGDGNDGVKTGGEYLEGGDWAELLDVLLGDFDNSGRVDFNDMYAVYQGIGGTYDPYLDTNGDGRIDFNDMYLVYQSIGNNLP